MTRYPRSRRYGSSVPRVPNFSPSAKPNLSFPRCLRAKSPPSRGVCAPNPSPSPLPLSTHAKSFSILPRTLTKSPSSSCSRHFSVPLIFRKNLASPISKSLPVMSHRSKREVAPPARETPATSFPWRGAAMNPNLPFPPPGEAMVPPPGWWTAQPPHNNSFFPPYGPLMGSVPTYNANGNLETSTDSVECLPGGFQSLLQNGMNSSTPPPNEPITQDAASGLKRKTIINIDEGEDVRTEKRLAWTPADDKQLVSAWIFHSNDPIRGNGKKNDHYWGDLHAHYNSTAPPNRKRKVKHLRDRFQKIKRWVGLFCGSWAKATSIYTSGQSDDQLKEKALQFYLDDYKEGPFTVMHCWEIMKDERKWLALLDELEGSNKLKLNDEREVEENIKKVEGNSEKERPIGTKQAKKQRMGKGKGKAKDNGFEEDMKKYMDIQAAATKRHEEFLETQQRVSDAKVEAAKLRKEAAILESYKTLMSMDTSNMDDEMKAEHKLGLKILRDKMVGNAN